MEQKPCRGSCGKVRPLSEFYAHPQMADGHLNICKACKREYARGNRLTPEEERERNQSPKRKRLLAKMTRAARVRNPLHYKARTAVGNALRDGKLVRKPCEVCQSEKSEAHHDDYTKPLDVRWMCRKHHKAWHRAHPGAE